MNKIGLFHIDETETNTVTDISGEWMWKCVKRSFIVAYSSERYSCKWNRKVLYLAHTFASYGVWTTIKIFIEIILKSVGDVRTFARNSDNGENAISMRTMYTISEYILGDYLCCQLETFKRKTTTSQRAKCVQEFWRRFAMKFI